MEGQVGLADMSGTAKYWRVAEDGYHYSFSDESSTAWQMMRCELDELEALGRIIRDERGYLVGHALAASFDAERCELLHLPPRFPYRMSVETQGDVSSPDFRFLIDYLAPNGHPFVHPVVVGSYIRLYKGAEFLLDAEQYALVRTSEEVARSIGMIPDQTARYSFALRKMAEIKDYCRKIDAGEDRYMEDTVVLTPDKMTIAIRRDGEDYRVEPVLIKEQDGEMHYVEAPAFLQSFQQRRNVQDCYLGRDGVKYAFTKEQTKALGEIRAQEHIDKEKFQRMLLQPREFFSSSEFVFDQEVYSDRVQAYAEYVPKSLPIIKLTNGKWLPEEGEIPSDRPASNEPPLSEENAEEIRAKLTAAEEAGETCIKVDGRDYPITEHLRERVRDILQRMMQAEEAAAARADSGDAEEKTGQKILVIGENIEELNCVAEERKRDLQCEAESVWLEGLKPGVTLYPYQKDGLQWMRQCWQEGYRGVLLADDMGLGKTLQTLAFLSGYKKNVQENPISSILIVAPVSLLRNWKTEIEHFVRNDVFAEVVELFSENMKRYKVSGLIDLSELGSDRIVLTTYETLRRYQLSFGRIKWSVMVADEAQKIKNPKAYVSLAAKAMQYDFAVALSGTPVENSWVDLWNIMDFAVPGKLGSLKAFNEKYQSRLKAIKDDQQALVQLGSKLREDLKPVFLRRMKKDCLQDLPKKEEQHCREVMPEKQKQAYLELIRDARRQDVMHHKGQALRFLAAIRETSLYPHLGDYSDEALAALPPGEIINASARLRKLFQILVNVRQADEKALIFITSRKMQRLLKVVLEKVFQISISIPINGELSGEKRQAIVDEFGKKKGFAVLLLSPEAGGVGFNITAANHVIHLSRTWNPAKEDQATDRAYRIGQEKFVHVYIPMAYHPVLGAGGAFDEKLDQLLSFKRKLSESACFPVHDEEREGLEIVGDILSAGGTDRDTEIGEYWTIEDMAHVRNTIFTHIICRLYDQTEGYEAIQITDRNNYGADIFVSCDKAKQKGLLICCMQSGIEETAGETGAEKLQSAIKVYEKKYRSQLTGIVITNGKRFTQSAVDRAKAYSIRLVAGEELAGLLRKYPICKNEF